MKIISEIKRDGGKIERTPFTETIKICELVEYYTEKPTERWREVYLTAQADFKEPFNYKYSTK